MTSQENISTLFIPHNPEIIEAIYYAWGVFFNLPTNETFCRRARAEIVNNIALNKLKQSNNFYPIEKNGTTLFLLENQIVFRIKFGDKNGYSKNYPTRAALDFHNPQIQFEELPNVKKCDVVYILNDTETEVFDIRIVVRNGRKITYSSSLLESNSVFAQNDIEELLTEEFNTVTTSIVKVKKEILPDQNKQIQDKK